ncbi:MAG: hypothetical protein ACRC7V_06445 [Lachnospiraceae bacterium]
MDTKIFNALNTVSVGCGIFALVAIWYGFKSVTKGLSALVR